VLYQRSRRDKLDPLAQLYHRTPQGRADVGFPSAAGAKYKDIGGVVQPVGRFGQLHEDGRIKAGNMGELKVRPGFSGGQLRFA
jgi:hypothetical protein